MRQPDRDRSGCGSGVKKIGKSSGFAESEVDGAQEFVVVRRLLKESDGPFFQRPLLILCGIPRAENDDRDAGQVGQAPHALEDKKTVASRCPESLDPCVFASARPTR
jgi:hypothetical protein